MCVCVRVCVRVCVCVCASVRAGVYVSVTMYPCLHVSLPGGSVQPRLSDHRASVRLRRQRHVEVAPMRKSAARLRVRVVQREVVHDDRHRKRDDQHAAYHAHRAHHVAGVPGWDDVTVADRRHGNDRPPDAQRDVGEVVVVDEVDGTGKHQNPEDEEYDDEHQLLRAHLLN